MADGVKKLPGQWFEANQLAALEQSRLTAAYINSGEADFSLEGQDFVNAAIMWAKSHEQKQMELAARRAGMTREEYYKWRKNHEKDKNKVSRRPGDNSFQEELDELAKEWMELWGKKG